MTGGRSNACLRKRHALQLFKTEMCKFFLQSRCENGEKCSYAHNANEVRQKPDLSRTSICRFMNEAGVCTNANCRFAHCEAELRATHGFFKMKMCGFAQSGRCKHGSNCRFAHSPEELRPAKPPPPGAVDDALIPRHQEGCNMNNFIFGTAGHEVPPPMAYPGSIEAMSSRRLQRRPATASNQPLPMRKCGHEASNRSIAEADTTTAVHSSTWNESDSADGSSWASGSSATEVPRSEHTGSPPTTSDSSSRTRNGGVVVGGPSSSNSGNATGSTSADQRAKANGRRPPRENDVANSAEKVCTLMITNVPTYLTQGALLSMFEDLTQGMRGKFDFFYCPWDEKMGQNLGYGFLNFPDPDHALAFQQRWTNKELCRGGRGQKPLRVMKAAVQGLQANLEYFSSVEVAHCTDLRFRPLYRDSNKILQPLPLNSASSLLPQSSFPALFSPPEDSLPDQHTSALPSRPTRRHQPPQSTQDNRRHYSQDVTSRASNLGGTRPSGRNYARSDLHPLRHQEALHLKGLGDEELMTTVARHTREHGRDSGHFGNFLPSRQEGAVQQSCCGGFVTADPKQDCWNSALDGVAVASGSASQDMMTWPIMMAAVPWPVEEQHVGHHAHGRQQQQQRSLQVHHHLGHQQGQHAYHQVSPQDMFFVATSGTSSDAGSCLGGPAMQQHEKPGLQQQQQQVQYPQMVQCMLMHMEGLMPASGNQIDRSSLLQIQAMPAMWPDSDEVYME